VPGRSRHGGRALIESSDERACLACGTCCFSTLERYVPVTGDDHARLDERAEELTRFIGNRAFMRILDGHCAALVIEPIALGDATGAPATGAHATGANHAGDARTARYACSVYEHRPDVCRELTRGSRECLGEIATKSERPLLALTALLANTRRRAVVPFAV
jgi:Fe-S-cluster containining protein